MASNRLGLGAGVACYALGVFALGWSLFADPLPSILFVGIAIALTLGTILIGVSRDRRAF